MRFGVCGSMIEGSGMEIVEQTREIGYDYIELSLAHLAALTDAEFDAVCRRVAAAGLTCEACNNFFPRAVRLTGSEVNWDGVGEYIHHAVSRAAAVGRAGDRVWQLGRQERAGRLPNDRSLEADHPRAAPGSRRSRPAGHHHRDRAAQPRREQYPAHGCRRPGDDAPGEAPRGAACWPIIITWRWSRKTRPSCARPGRLCATSISRGSRAARSPPAWTRIFQAFFEALTAAGYNGRVSVEGFTTNFY